jgi:branched-chain amino acid transport system permease protein
VFWQQVISGVANGSVYALLALSLGLIFKTTKIVNFAQGEMAMFTTFVAYTFLTKMGLSYPAAILLTLLVSVLIGVLVEFVLMRPLLKAPEFNSVIITLGLMLVLNSLASYIWGSDPVRFPSPVGSEPISLMGLIISRLHLTVILVSFAVMTALFLFLKYAKEGTALRAAIQNMRAAQLMGIKTGRVFSLAWALGTLIGALAGLLAAPVLFLDYNMMFMVLLKAFAAAVLGGFSSLPGVVVGGLVLGVFENLTGGYISSTLKDSIAFVLIIAVLLIRPQGLFGKVVIKKV